MLVIAVAAIATWILPAGSYATLAYDANRHVLLVSRLLRTSPFPAPLRAAQAYWPFYQDGSYNEQFKIIGAIDSLYQKKGYYAARVRVNEVEGGPGAARLIFDITEGSRVAIAQVIIDAL